MAVLRKSDDSVQSVLADQHKPRWLFLTFDRKHNPWFPLNVFHKPREINRVWWKNMAISQKAPFMRTLRYIFLTEWQLCAKRVDHGSRRVPRAPSNWQLVAHMDSRVSNMEAKLLAQQGVLVLLLPLNKEICHFSWQEQDCSASFWTNHNICNPWLNSDSSQRHRPRFLEASLSVKGRICNRGRQGLCWQRVQYGAGHVWTGDKVRGWNPSGERRKSSALEAISEAWCAEGCLNLISILNWGKDFAVPHRRTHFCQEESCAVCF